MISFLEMPKQQ